MRKRGYFTCCLLHMNSGEHAAKTYGEWRLTPHILNLSTRWTWVVTFTPRERVPSWVGPIVQPMVWGTDFPALHRGPSQRLNKGWRRAWPLRQMGVCSTVSGGSLLSQQVYTGVWCVPLFGCDVTLWLVNYCSSAEVQSERWHESVTLWQRVALFRPATDEKLVEAFRVHKQVQFGESCKGVRSCSVRTAWCCIATVMLLLCYCCVTVVTVVLLALLTVLAALLPADWFIAR